MCFRKTEALDIDTWSEYKDLAKGIVKDLPVKVTIYIDMAVKSCTQLQFSMLQDWPVSYRGKVAVTEEATTKMSMEMILGYTTQTGSLTKKDPMWDHWLRIFSVSRMRYVPRQSDKNWSRGGCSSPNGPKQKKNRLRPKFQRAVALFSVETRIV